VLRSEEFAQQAGRLPTIDPYSELQFFPKLFAFNIGWHEAPKRTIYSFIEPRGFLTKPGFSNHDRDHSHRYKGFPQLKRMSKARQRSSLPTCVQNGWGPRI
jgi:hypothetical protein